MSDQSLRRTERQVSNDPAAMSRLLVERVRAGALARDRLEFLAHLFYEPAYAALGWELVGYKLGGEQNHVHRQAQFRREGQEKLFEIPVHPTIWAYTMKRWPDLFLRVGVAAAWRRFRGWCDLYDNLLRIGYDMPLSKERVQDLLHMLDLQALYPGQHPQFFTNRELDQNEFFTYRQASKSAVRHEGGLLVRAGPVHHALHVLQNVEPGVRLVPIFAGALGLAAGTGDMGNFSTAMTDCQEGPFLNDDCRHCGERAGLHHGSVGGDPDYPHDSLSDHSFEPLPQGEWSEYVLSRIEDFHQGVRDELVPFVLGERDAVAERVKAQKEAYACS